MVTPNKLTDYEAVICLPLTDMFREVLEFPRMGRLLANDIAQISIAESPRFTDKLFPKLLPRDISRVPVVVVIEPSEGFEPGVFGHQFEKPRRAQMHTNVVQQR